MKTTVVDKAPKGSDKLPRLMREVTFPDTIVLVHSKNFDGSFDGIVVSSESRAVGYTYPRWGAETLEAFFGTVTLEQE